MARLSFTIRTNTYRFQTIDYKIVYDVAHFNQRFSKKKRKFRKKMKKTVTHLLPLRWNRQKWWMWKFICSNSSAKIRFEYIVFFFFIFQFWGNDFADPNLPGAKEYLHCDFSSNVYEINEWIDVQNFQIMKLTWNERKWKKKISKNRDT